MGIFDFLKKNKNLISENGLNEIYYDNGRGKLKERFTKKIGKKEGIHKRYFDGIPLCLQEDGLSDDELATTNVIASWHTYKEGILDGEFEACDGELKGTIYWLIGKYKNGHKDGLIKLFSSTKAQREDDLKWDLDLSAHEMAMIEKWEEGACVFRKTYSPMLGLFPHRKSFGAVDKITLLDENYIKSEYLHNKIMAEYEKEKEDSGRKQDRIIEKQNMIPNEHLPYIPNNQNITENKKFNIKDESKVYEVIAEEREYYEVNHRENIFYGFWIDIHIQDEGLHIEGVDYYGDYPVIESKDEDDNYNYYLVTDIPYEIETENNVRFHHCDDFTTEESATRYIDNIKVMKYKDALKKGIIPASKNNDEVIEKDKSAETKDTELSENIDIKVTPNWFEGEVLSKGDIVKNQDGIAISLTSVELSIYNLLIEHCIIIKMGLHKEIMLDEMNKCVNWLKQNTSKKQYIFMLKEAYILAETKQLKELIDKEESTKDVIEIVEEENKPAPTVDSIKSLTEFADKENIPLKDNKEASKMINEDIGKINEITKEEKYNSIVDELTKLGALKEKGLLTEEEFNEQKKKLLKQ